MIQITDLKRIGKSENYRVFCFDEELCKLQAETIVKHHIKIGAEFSEKQFEEIRQESEKLCCFSDALSYVSKSLKTQKQVQDKLTEKGYLQTSIDNAIKKLVEYGYINDKYFAETFIRQNKDKKGVLYLKQALKTKGVSSGIMSEIFEDFETDKQDIIAVAEKFLNGKQIDIFVKQKLYRHLMSKGFTFEQVKSATAEMFKGLDDEIEATSSSKEDFEKMLVEKQSKKQKQLDTNDIRSLAEKFLRGKEKDIFAKQKMYRSLLAKGYKFEDIKQQTEDMFEV